MAAIIMPQAGSVNTRVISPPGGPPIASESSSTSSSTSPTRTLNVLSQAELAEVVAKLSIDDLERVFEEVRRRKEAIYKEVEDTYGKWFCDAFGTQKVASLPVVDPRDLGLDQADLSKYPIVDINRVAPHLGDSFAVRGIMGVEFPRPFVAVTVHAKDQHNREKVAVELFFKRYSLNGDGARGQLYEHNYVTALNLLSKTGEPCFSEFYSSGGMTREQVTALRRVVEGQTIKAPVSESSVRKV